MMVTVMVVVVVMMMMMAVVVAFCREPQRRWVKSGKKKRPGPQGSRAPLAAD
jgi:hypothetical protein